MLSAHNYKFFILIFLLAILFSSCANIRYRTGNAYYDELLYADAAKKYEMIGNKSKYEDVIFKLGDCYRLTGNNNKALSVYQRIVVQKNCKPIDRFYYAEALMKAGRYKDAKNWFDSYLKNTNINDTRAQQLYKACDSLKVLYKDSALYVIQLMPFNANNVSSYSPAFFKDGLVFVSDRSSPTSKNYRSGWTGQKYVDLFYTENLEGDNWSMPQPFADGINSPYNEGPCIFNKDNNIIYFTRNSLDRGKPTVNAKLENNLKIYKGVLDNNTWKTIGELSFNNNNYSVFHPAIAQQGQSMYFASDMPWGYGGTDIYRVKFINGRWSKPENLGPEVNTMGNEAFPFIVGDSILFFASDGKFGFGGYDIFEAEIENDKWVHAVNLGSPVNSSADDFGLIIQKGGDKGYFASNRNSKTDRIYSFKKAPPQVSIIGTVTNFPENELIPNCKVKITSTNNVDTVIDGDSKGQFKFGLDLNQSYKFLVSDKAYYAAGFEVQTYGKKSSEIQEIPVALDHIILKKSKIYYKLKFETKTTVFKKTTQPALQELALVMKQNPQIKIEIVSHTDSRGDDKPNLTLTLSRANSLKDALVLMGIDGNRIATKAMGESVILNHCKNGKVCIEEEHEDNNRVEITVTSIDN